MSSLLEAARDALAQRADLSDLQLDGDALLARLDGPQSSHALIGLDDGDSLRLVVHLLDQDGLTEDIVAGLFRWSREVQLARFVGQDNGIWLRQDIPAHPSLVPAELLHAVDRALDVIAGFIEGDAERMTRARALPGAARPSREAVEAGLQLWGYAPDWKPGLDAWALSDPEERISRPPIAFWDEGSAVLSLVIGVQPMETDNPGAQLAWTLLQVNDRLAVSRYALMPHLGLVLCTDVPMHHAAGARPWVEGLIEDMLTGASLLSPRQDDLFSKVRLTRQWITHTAQQDGVPMTEVLQGVLAAFRGEEPPALGKNPLWSDVLGETALLLNELAQQQPQALVIVAMTCDIGDAESVENMWELLESYASS
ncbi:MAG: hypothetical protein H6740_02800 [Alphaproteobacteria bacterium]|nr:hypothetical protein [Alphaproteobacteria bacterium]